MSNVGFTSDELLEKAMTRAAITFEFYDLFQYLRQD